MNQNNNKIIKNNKTSTTLYLKNKNAFFFTEG